LAQEIVILKGKIFGKAIMKGKFITFEGSEGCGKSTQSRLLYNFLKKRGYKVIYLREPGGTKVSETVRNILLDPKNKKISCECELLLYMAARAQVVSEIIEPALKQGELVISDRFLDSTLAYQGYGLGLSLKLIKTIGSFATRRINPNLTIFLDLSLKEAFKAVGRIKDRIERRPLTYHQRVRQGYVKLAQKYPARIKIIKVEGNKNKTQSNIRRLVLKRIEGKA
jgi:dTMP kinase